MWGNVNMLYGPNVNPFDIDPGTAAASLNQTFGRLAQSHFVERLWSRRVDLWSSDPDVQQSIANRLGWLDAADVVAPQIPRLMAFADAIRTAGFTDVVLMGMGGSSLAPEVLRQVLGVAPGFPRFRVLDSVDPDAVRDAMAAAATSLFLFASKSGGTIEPNAMAAEARRRVEAAGVGDWGSRVVAITDEGTALHRRANDERFRDVFLNPSTIGGRFSALSFFGLVPAALMGIDLGALVDGARGMAEACRDHEPRTNAGVALGAIMAAAALEGRDKLTVVLPARLAPFGLWVEQLVAESTGKHGTGVVPVAGEGADAPIGGDRVTVVVHLGDESPDAALPDRLRASGGPVVDIHMPDALSLGAEFFRWEIATAAAGWLLDINPFDEPNVKQAKDATDVLLRTYVAERSLPMPAAHALASGIRMTLTSAARTRLGGEPATRFLDLAQPGDYVALLAYLPPEDDDRSAMLGDARRRLGLATRCATMFGFGPRYLHSTGQLHKGGGNNGLFVILTAPSSDDLPIPGAPYSFGVLEEAQALGDFLSLDHTGRRALLLQLPGRDLATLRLAFDLLMT